MFAANPGTLERMHTATFIPELADRKLREQWELEGSSTIRQRALNKAREILSTSNPVAFTPEVDARVRAGFDGLVAGDSELQEGWQRHKVGPNTTQRERRPNRRRKKKTAPSA
jgi:trimethylamine:corrinoid methyltransferase-like protein